MSVQSDRAPNCVLNDSKTTETIVLRLLTLLTQTPMASCDSQVYDIHSSSDTILGERPSVDQGVVANQTSMIPSHVTQSVLIVIRVTRCGQFGAHADLLPKCVPCGCMFQ